MSVLSLKSIKVAVDGGGEEDGVLVLREETLVAVLVCLESSIYQEDVGYWHLEAGFGNCAARPDTFTTREVALRWMAGRLKLDVDAAVAPALAGFRPFAID